MIKVITINELKNIINNKNNLLGISDTCIDIESIINTKSNYCKLLSRIDKNENIYIFCLLTHLDKNFFIELTNEYTLADHRFPGVQTDKPCKTIFIHSNLHDVKDNMEQLAKAIK